MLRFLLILSALVATANCAGPQRLPGIPMPGLTVRGLVTPKGQQQGRELKPADDIGDEDSVALQIETDAPAYIYVAKGLSGGQPRLIYPEQEPTPSQPGNPIRIVIKTQSQILIERYDRTVEFFILGSSVPLPPSLVGLLSLRPSKGAPGSRGPDGDESNKKDSSEEGGAQRETRTKGERDQKQAILVEPPAPLQITIVPFVIRKR